MQYHPAANIFPMMAGDEFESLKNSIKTSEQHVPIYLYDGMILDGRNRYKACIELGIEPKYEQYTGSEPYTFVVALNKERRHLNSSQLAFAALTALPELEREAKSRQSTHKENDIYLVELIPQAETGKTRDKAAQQFGTNPRYIQDAKKLRKDAPELAAKIEAGEITIPDAIKEIRKAARTELIENQIEDIRANDYKPVNDLFDVIVIDPPWPYGTEYDPEGRRAANPYPEMSLQDIGNIKIPASNDCILWLWTTHKFMRYSFDLLDKWGFRDVAILTWVKSRMGLGSWLRSQSEFCIMAVKGKPIINLTDQTTIISGPMREHSRKPDEFYGMVDSLCVGYKLDYFSRQERPGWTVFGNDTGRFSNEL